MLLYRGDEGSRHAARFADIGELEQSAGFTQEEAIDLSRSINFSLLLLLLLSTHQTISQLFYFFDCDLKKIMFCCFFWFLKRFCIW